MCSVVRVTLDVKHDLARGRQRQKRFQAQAVQSAGGVVTGCVFASKGRFRELPQGRAFQLQKEAHDVADWREGQ